MITNIIQAIYEALTDCRKMAEQLLEFQKDKGLDWDNVTFLEAEKTLEEAMVICNEIQNKIRNFKESYNKALKLEEMTNKRFYRFISLFADISERKSDLNRECMMNGNQMIRLLTVDLPEKNVILKEKLTLIGSY